eukprot:3558039-Pyramimonas_sp.AAC.1
MSSRISRFRTARSPQLRVGVGGLARRLDLPGLEIPGLRVQLGGLAQLLGQRIPRAIPSVLRLLHPVLEG